MHGSTAAVIRWSDLISRESEILSMIEAARLQDPRTQPYWPALERNLLRIHDGMVEHALEHELKQFPEIEAASSVDLTVAKLEVTIRHVILRDWMTKYYPDDRPSFLFWRATQTIGAKSETSRLNIIGGLLKLMLQMVSRRSSSSSTLLEFLLLWHGFRCQSCMTDL
jgi:hypothetical protein